MRSYNLEGIIIKRSNYGEADKLVTLFTKTHGKVTLMARSIRKLTSKRAGSLELFNLVKISAVPGRGQIDTLTEVQSLKSFTDWKSQMGRVNIAYQLAETVDKLTPDRQPHPQIFTILSNGLSQISELGASWQQTVENWLLQIITELGFWSQDQEFKGDIYEFIESVSERSLNSPKLLKKLRN